MYIAEQKKKESLSHDFMINEDNLEGAKESLKKILREIFPKRFVKRGSIEREIEDNWKLTNLNDWV